MPSILPECHCPPSRLRPGSWPRKAVTVRARQLWERAGYPVGRDEEFWFEAEHQVVGSAGVAPDRSDAGPLWWSQGSSRHVLIVDDQTCFGWTWAAALRRAGFRVSIAASADLGWSTLDEREFALLITSQDWVGRRSLELVDKVRRRSRITPCILVREQVGFMHDRLERLVRPGAIVERSVPINRLLALVRGLLAASEDPQYVPVAARWGVIPWVSVPASGAVAH